MRRKTKTTVLSLLLAAVLLCLPFCGASAQEARQTSATQLEQGLYFLKNKGSGLYASADTENTQSIRQQPFSGENNQIWVIKRSADAGYYNVQNGLLDASYYLAQGLQTTSNRAAASMLSGGAFNVSISNNTDGTYFISGKKQSMDFTKYLEIPNNSNASGSLLSWYTFDTASIDYHSWYLEPAGYVLGDANMDGYLDIRDATEIQMYLAGYESFTAAQTYLADFDCNGVVDIRDATAIQMYLAGKTVRINGQLFQTGTKIQYIASYGCGATVNSVQGKVTYPVELLELDKESIDCFIGGSLLVSTKTPGVINFNSFDIGSGIDFQNSAPILTATFTVKSGLDVQQGNISLGMEIVSDLAGNNYTGTQSEAVEALTK